MCAPDNEKGGAVAEGEGGAKFSDRAGQASAALQIVGAVTDYIGQNQRYEANAANAAADFTREVDALGAQAGEINEATGEQVLTNALAGARAKAEANVRGASMGLGRVSTRALVQQAGFAEGRTQTITLANRDNQIEQVGRDLSGAQVNAQRRVDSVRRGSPLGLALQIGSTIASTASSVATAGAA